MKFKVDAFIAVFKTMKAEIVTGRNLLSDMLSVIRTHMKMLTHIFTIHITEGKFCQMIHHVCIMLQ